MSIELRTAWLAASLAAIACAAHRPARDGAEPPPLLQLGSDVRPLHYALDLEVDPARDAGIRGSVAIDVELTRTRSTIWMHGRDLRVAEATVTVGDGAPVRAGYQQVNAEGVVRISPARPVGPGRAKIRIAFEAPWGKMEGAFRTRSGELTYVATQLEAVDARRAFPCFDDPQFKAPLDLTLRVPEGAVAVGNGPEVEAAPDGPGRRRVRFASTPPLPTYLVFFAVGPFDVITPPPLAANEVRATPLPVRVVVPRGRARDAAFLAEVSGWAVPALERYFGIPFPYAKLDHVVVPDMGSAMENAGAIAYGERLVLLDPGITAAPVLRFGANTIAHELAHQWFGDLVTLRWWDDVWLNESFATWIAGKVLEAEAPRYREDLERLRDTEQVMRMDALASARAIRQPVERVSALADQFDFLSYAKGAAVLSMFERFTGPERFRAGVRAYLAARLHGTATSEDLLQALSRAAGEDLTGPFRTFLDAPGAPLVEAAVSCTGARARISLRQSRELPRGAKSTREDRWVVPVCLRLGIGGTIRERCVLLREAAAALELEEGCPDWIFPNAAAAGYYRWALAPADLERLRTRGLARLPEPERIAFASGVAAAARTGALRWDTAMEVHLALVDDAPPDVVVEGVQALREAHDELLPEQDHPALERLARAVYGPVLARLSLRARPEDAPELRRLRASLVELLAHPGKDGTVRRELAELGGKYLGAAGAPTEPGAVDPDIAITALSVAAEEGGPAVFELALRRVRDSAD
ncbi:MAG TPA: M1 family metallopeptidase, partial [Anaeromyxobacteraceae bacterium]|nr:M1 family metallopeptidase [Anaeromyxobacteraceae bacterium]